VEPSLPLTGLMDKLRWMRVLGDTVCENWAGDPAKASREQGESNNAG
jgi:hypothetical protein